MAKAKLTERMKRFADEYLIDLKPIDAYRRAGYKANDNAASVNAHKLLNDSRVQEYIKVRMKDREKRTKITQDRVLQELAKIGFANITDYLKVDGQDYQAKDMDGNPVTRRAQYVDIFETANIDRIKLDAVAEIRQTKEGISIKLHDKVSALEKIGKHLGMFVEKVEHSGKDGVPLQVVFNIPRPPKENKP